MLRQDSDREAVVANRMPRLPRDFFASWDWRDRTGRRPGGGNECIGADRGNIKNLAGQETNFRERVGMSSRFWVIAALAAWAMGTACSTFNTNLTPQSGSSLLQFLGPSEALAGGSDFTLTATGQGFGFASGATILWDGDPRPTTYVSSTRLTAVISAADIATPGKVDVTIFIPGSSVAGTSGINATGTTDLSNVVIFTIRPPANPVPVITSLDPSSREAGTGAFTLTVTGTGFVTGSSGSVIFWNGGPRPTNVASATQASAQISGTDIAAAGTANVQVFNPTPGGGSSNSVAFTITSPQALTSDASLELQLKVSSPGVSADRRYVVFAMTSTDGATDRPGTIRNVFLRDTCEGAPEAPQECSPATSLVSIGIDGHPGDGDSSSPSISADGRWVAFASSATNLVEGDTNGVSDVFVRDTCIISSGSSGAAPDCEPSTVRVSLAADRAEANGPSSSVSISATGRFITFRSEATNLDPASSPSTSDMFLTDTCAGAQGDCTPSTQRIDLRK